MSEYLVSVKYSSSIVLTDTIYGSFKNSHDGMLEFIMDFEELEEKTDSFYMSEILESTMEFVSNFQNHKMPFENCKDLKLNIVDYQVSIKKE